VHRGIALALLLALCVAGVSSGARAKGSCSIRGLGVASVHVVGLSAEGVSCTSARTIAGKVAADLAHGRSISIPGSVGFGMSQQTCTGCKTTTSISVTYPHGKVTVSLTGGTGSTGPTTPMPSFGSPGGGTVI
jgi:hypothetical protein